MTPQISPVASRYANAFLDIVIEKKAEKAVSADIESLKNMIMDGDVFINFTKDVTISREEQMASIEAVAKKAKFNVLTTNFLKLLSQNGRLNELIDMINAYDVVLDERQGNKVVMVQSAFPLKAAQEKKIKGELDKALGVNTEIITEVDKSLLGGVIITVGSRMIDDSVKGKLDRLSRAMKSKSDTDVNIKKAS